MVDRKAVSARRTKTHIRAVVFFLQCRMRNPPISRALATDREKHIPNIREHNSTCFNTMPDKRKYIK